MSVRELNKFELQLLGITVLACALASAVGSHTIFNRTNSLPLGFYWFWPSMTLERGELVAFRIPQQVRSLVVERGYLPADAYLVKPIAAVAGDHVCIGEGSFRVNGRIIGAQLERDAEGRALPQYRACGVVPPGEFYVASEHARSFDSRVFGPVQGSEIQGKVKPVWTY